MLLGMTEIDIYAFPVYGVFYLIIYIIALIY